MSTRHVPLSIKTGVESGLMRDPVASLSAGDLCEGEAEASPTRSSVSALLSVRKPSTHGSRERAADATTLRSHLRTRE